MPGGHLVGDHPAYPVVLVRGMDPARGQPRREASASLKVFDGRMTAEAFSSSGR
jgi:hypothetical protein